MTSDDRHSVADTVEITKDPDALARQEAENGLRQYNTAMDVVRNHVNDAERPFRLRVSHILRLNLVALDGIDRMAGAFRNTGIKISKSKHVPPDFAVVPRSPRTCATTSTSTGMHRPATSRHICCGG